MMLQNSRSGFSRRLRKWEKSADLPARHALSVSLLQAMAIAMLALPVVLSASSVQARTETHPQGAWGPSQGCTDWQAGEPSLSEVAPWEIGERWVTRGIYHCLITARPVEAPDGRIIMNLRCGEDAREIGYYLTLSLDDDAAMTMTWNPVGTHEHYRFGPYAFCGAAPGS